MKKERRIISLFIGIILIFTIAIIIVKFNPGNFAGKAVSQPGLPNSPDIALRERVIKLQQETNSLETKANALERRLPARDDSLKKILDDASDTVEKYQQKLGEDLPSEEKERLLHQYSHDIPQEKVVYVEKMVNLPTLLNELQQNVQVLQQKVTLYRITVSSTLFSTFNSKINTVRSKSSQGEYESTMQEIELLRDEVLPEILRLTKDAREKNYRADFKTALDQVRWSLTIKLPHDYQKFTQGTGRVVASPPASGTSLTGGAVTAFPSMGTSFKPSPPSQRTIRALVCSVQFGTQPAGPINYLQRDIPLLNDYIQEVSFGNHRVVTQYAQGYYNGPQPQDFEGVVWSAIIACDSTVDFTNIDLIIIPHAGTAGTLSPWHLLSEEGYFTAGVVWIGDYITPVPGSNCPFCVGVLAHEVGHSAYSLTHANGYVNNQRIEYANPFDDMGYNYHYQGHFNGFYKYYGNMVSLQTVTEDNFYTLHALELPSASYPHVLRIPFSDVPFCLEYRKPVGRDFFQDLEEEIIPAEGCLLLNECSIVRPLESTTLIDTHPNTASLAFRELGDACLHDGELFENKKVSLSFTAQQPEINSATVKINLNKDDSLDLLPDLSITMSDRYLDLCTLRGRVEVNVMYEKEMLIDKPLKVKLIGITTTRQQIILKEQIISSVPAHWVWNPELFYNNQQNLKYIIAQVDPYNEIPEANENNNEIRIQRQSC